MTASKEQPRPAPHTAQVSGGPASLLPVVPFQQQRHCVLLAHPGTQYSRETALALQKGDLLQTFLTGLHFDAGGTFYRTLHKLPLPYRQKWLREISRRTKPELNPRKIRIFPFAELLYVASTRLAPFRRFSDSLLRWRNKRFDAQVARTLANQRPAAVVCYDTCALSAFQAARSLGIRCFLDQSIGHVRAGAEIYRQEAELHPDFADSIPDHVPEALIDRCTREALLADCVLAPSDYVRLTLLSGGVDPSRIQLVPFGVDTERFRPSARRKEDVFRALFVGQLSQRKGIKYLLEAWKHLRLPRAELVLVGGIVGSGAGLAPYAGSFRHVAALPHAEVHQLFAEADIFVYPSLHEGSALAIYEALACGLPVVTTPNSGSVVRDGREGFVVPIRDVEALQEKILLLYSNHELRQEMSLRARSRAEKFTWAAYRHRLVAAILDLLTAESGEQHP